MKLFLMSIFSWKNCLVWAKTKQEIWGGYLMSRPTHRAGIWKLLGGKHYLWHPGRCPDKGKTCPHIEAYVPKGDLPDWQLPINFEGFVVKGDPDPSSYQEEDKK